MTYGKIIFGDNQFLGVNHADQNRARALYNEYENADNIIRVIGYAYDVGIRDFMFTAHARYDEVFKEIVRSRMFPGMYFTPCVPYAHKHWKILSETGMFGLIRTTTSRLSFSKMVQSVFRSFLGDHRETIALVTKIEMTATLGLPIRGVFLQNLAFDLLVAMELHGVIEDYDEAIRSRIGVIPGYITMNHPRAISVLCDKIGLVRPWLCANYNISGFRMNPSPMQCLESFESQKTHNIAMSILSSGRDCSEDALGYVGCALSRGDISAVLFGSSNDKHIKYNYERILGAK